MRVRVEVVGVMAKVIEFYIPDSLRDKRHRSPPEQRGKVIEFPPTEVTGVASESRSDFTKLRIADGKGYHANDPIL